MTQWMGLPFGSMDSNILCRHGLVADNPQARMENDGLQSEDWKEKSASLPDCCHGGELIGFPSKLLGNVSKDVDENDNHQEEEEFLSLEDSTETLVISTGGDDTDDNDMGLTLGIVDHVEEELSAQGNTMEGGVGEPFSPSMEAKTESNPASGTTGEIDEPNSEAESKGVKAEEDICDGREQRMGLHYNSSSENKDTSKEKFHELPNVEKNTSEETGYEVVAARQHEHLDAPKDRVEKPACSLLLDEPSPVQCGDNAVGTVASSDCLVASLGSGITSHNDGLDENNFADSQKECIPSMLLVEGVAELRTDRTKQQPSDGQVILRKRKVGYTKKSLKLTNFWDDIEDVL